MANRRRKQTVQVEGMNLSASFTLPMSLALALVMGITGFLLVQSVTTIARATTEQRLVDSVRYTGAYGHATNYKADSTRLSIGDTGVVRVPVTLESGPVEPITEMYQAEASEKGIPVRLLLAPDTGKTDRGFLGLIACVIALVIGVGAIVSVAVARKVTKPLEGLVDDVRHIARGNLGHRISVRGAREIVLLGKSIDRMASSLQESQDAEIELSAREREMEVAGEVREALVPEKTPQVEGYWVGGLQDSCAEPGGDFYDFVEREDGKLGLLLCEVSGKGVPGALIAATARAYLRTILSSASDVNEGLRLVNRFFAPDVRRGMYVTSLYVLLDPSEHSAEVACAGHQVPLLSYTAADRKLRKIQPEGIALGFDKGPIFERTLQTSKVDLAPGDRLVLSNAGPLLVQNEAGEEFGEQSFFRGVMKRSALPGDEFLSDLDFAFETFADGEPYPSDISILTVQRNA